LICDKNGRKPLIFVYTIVKWKARLNEIIIADVYDILDIKS